MRTIRKLRSENCESLTKKIIIRCLDLEIKIIKITSLKISERA